MHHVCQLVKVVLSLFILLYHISFYVIIVMIYHIDFLNNYYDTPY